MINRRDFLKGTGSVLISFSMLPGRTVLAQAGGRVPRFARSNPQLDAWIRIAADGTVTVYPGRVELGQGVVTALGQIAAEELQIDFQRIHMSTVDTDHSPNEGITAGSMSIEQGGAAMRAAATEARQVLVEMASGELNAGADSIEVRDGRFLLDGRETGLDYWQVIGDQEFDHNISGMGEPVPAAEHRIIGTPVQRLDIPAKAFGEAIFIHDFELPGMLHARVVRPPAPGARLRSLDMAAAARIPGITKVIRDGSFLAVVAAREELAVAGVEKLNTLCRWSRGRDLPDVNGMAGWLKSAQANVSVIAEAGNPGVNRNGPTVSAEYTRPYHAHASISPSIALAWRDEDGLTVWSHSQGVYVLRDALAGLTGLDRDQIRCVHKQGCGCYGHNGADDAACDAAIIAMYMPGKPVRLQYSRADEFRWEPCGSAMAMRVEAALDDKGMVSDWQYHVWSCTHSTRPRGAAGAGNLLSANMIDDPVSKPAPGNIPQPNGGGDRNAVPLYAFPDMRISKHFIPAMPVRVSALRGLGAYANVFAIESFMDELAQRAGIDPIDFRIAHLADQRAIEVLNRVRENSGWDEPVAENTGRGIGFARYKNHSAYCAVVMHVIVEPSTGDIKLLRAVAAADAGQAINPDGLKNQIEGGIIQSSSWTLKEQVKFSKREMLSVDWESYPVLRFSETPEVEVTVIDRPELPSLGAGEAAQGPAAAAIANAVADAAGVRLRDLPLKLT